MNKRVRNRKTTAYKFPHSIHRFRSLSPYWIRGRQLEAATEIAMNQVRSELLSALQGGDLDSLKETLAKDLDPEMKSFKAILGKRHRRGSGQPRQRLILISAIEEGNLEKVKDLLSDGVDCNDVQKNLCNVRRKERLYAIHKATLLGLTDIVEVLLDAGANSNVFDQNIDTPLHIAVNQGSTSMVRLLLSHGADPKLTDHHGNAAIHIATSQGHLNLVRTLIEFNADIHQMNSVGHQPVHIAAATGHFHIIHLLCSADPRNVMARDSAGQCPLHLAAENGHVETVTALLDLFGADPNERNLEGEVPLLRLLCKPYRKNIMRDMVYYYATFMALVQYGASLHVESSRGLTLLEIAEANQYTKIAESLKAVRGAANAGKQKDLRRDTDNAKGPSARETYFNNTVSIEIPRTELCEVQSASVKQVNETASCPSLKHVSFKSPGNEFNDVQLETLSHSSHLLHAPKMSNLVGETCEQNSIAKSIQNNIPFTRQVTASHYVARNELLNSASPMVNNKPVQCSSLQPQHHSKVSFANEYRDVHNFNKQKQVGVLENETNRSLVSLVKDDGKASEIKTGTVCLVKLEPVRPDHYVIQTLSTSISSLNSSRSRLPGRKEVDSDVKLCAELTAFDKDIGVSDEDFSEDFVSDTDSSEDSECVLGQETTLVEKQDYKMEKQLEYNGDSKLTEDFTVKELIAYFDDDIKHKSFDYEESHKTLSSAKESNNEAVPEKQKTIPTTFLCSSNSYRPRQKEDREIYTGQLLTGVDFAVECPQASDEKQIVKVNASRESEIVSDLSQNENEVQVAKVKCSTGLHLFPLEIADIVNSQAVEGPEESAARKQSETDDLLSNMQSENNAQVNGGNLALNSSVIKRNNKLPSGDERLLSSANSQALHSKENPAVANVSDNVPEDIKQKLKKKKNVNKKPQLNEAFEMTDCTKVSAVISTESPVGVRRDEHLNQMVRCSNRNELAATEIEAVDCYNIQSSNCSTAAEEHLNDFSFHSSLSTSDLGPKTAKGKKKKKKKKTKGGELVQTKSLESTFDDELTFEFIQQPAVQTVCNTQQKCLVQADPSVTATGFSSKDVTKKKKKKNAKFAEACEFTNVSAGTHILSRNCKGLFEERTKRNWRTNLDEAPVVMHLEEESGQEQADHFHRDNSAINKDAVLFKTQMTNSKARKIRSELCSAFGISQDTNIDNDLMKHSLHNRAGIRASTENVPDWSGSSHEEDEDDRHLLWPKETVVNGGKQQALSRNSETNFSSKKTYSENCKPRVTSVFEEHDKLVDGRMTSPQVSRISTNSGSSSVVSLGRDGQFVNSGKRMKDIRQNAPDSNQHKSFLVQTSKETCIDDDFDEGDALERIRYTPSSDCNYKETDVDESFNCDNQQFRPDKEKDPHASEHTQVSYDRANNMSTITESRNEGKLTLPDLSSVGTRSTCVKKPSKKKKSQKQLKTYENPKLESVETLSDAAADGFSESELLNNPESSNKSPEPHFNGSLEDKDMLYVESVSSANLDAAAEYHRDQEQEKLESVVKDTIGNDSDQMIPAVDSPLVSEESRTESEDSSDSSDNSSGEFVFGQSRTLFTIKELIAEAESEEEDDQLDEMVDEDEGTYKDTKPLGDDWDDFDLSELHTRRLEKLKLTAQTMEIGRRLYEAETDEEDQIATDAKSECLKELPFLNIKSVGVSPPVQPFTASPPIQQVIASSLIQPVSASPPIQPFTASPPIQPFTASPPIQQVIASSPIQPFSASPPIQPFSASPPIQSCTASPSAEPSTTASDVVSNILGQDSENPVHVGDDLLVVQKPIARDKPKVVKVRKSKKKKNSARSFLETSFDDMEPVSIEVGNSSEKATDNVHDNFFNRTTVPTNSSDNSAINYDLSNKFSNSKEKPCVEQECLQSSSVSNESFELKQEPVKKPKYLRKGSEMELSELPSVSQDSLNDREDIHQTIAKSEHGSEEEEEEEGLNYETEDLADVDVAVSQPSKDRLVKNVHFSEEKEVKPDVQTKESVEDDLINENVERGENEKLITDGIDDEMDCSRCFGRQQAGRVSRGRQKKGTRQPIRVMSDKRTSLVFASPPANDATFDLVSEEVSCDKKDTEYFDNKSASKTERTSLSSSFEKVESSSKDSDVNSRKLASDSVSEVIVLRKRGRSGKPPLPKAVDRKASADGSNQSSPDIQGNTFHALKDTAHRILSPLPNLKDHKILSSALDAGIVQQQKMGRERTLPVTVRGLSNSFEEKTSDLRRSSLKSADHSSFERPRSADGISNTQLIPPHPVISHSTQRQMRRRPGSQKVMTSEDIRQRQMKNTEQRLDPIVVKPPEKTLQEAAFESITASILSQSKLHPGRRAKPEDVPVTYSRGVYRPHPVIFRGSLSAGSGFDDSRTSADMGYHPSSGSGNESWCGNE